MGNYHKHTHICTEHEKIVGDPGIISMSGCSESMEDEEEQSGVAREVNQE